MESKTNAAPNYILKGIGPDNISNTDRELTDGCQHGGVFALAPQNTSDKHKIHFTTRWRKWQELFS